MNEKVEKNEENIDRIDYIVNDIEQLKANNLLIEQYNVERAIEGPTAKVLEKEREFVKKIEKQKMQLLNKIDELILNPDIDKISYNVDKMLNTLNQLKNMLADINFDNVVDNEKQFKQYKYEILKNKKNKTFAQQIEILDYENVSENIEFKERENEKQEIQKDINKTNKIGMKDRIIGFLNRFFNKKRMLTEKKDLNKELQEKTENNEKTFKQKLQEQVIENPVQNKTPEELKKEQLRKYFESAENAKKRLKEQSKLYSNETEWKNGNIVTKNEDQEKDK